MPCHRGRRECETTCRLPLVQLPEAEAQEEVDQLQQEQADLRREGERLEILTHQALAIVGLYKANAQQHRG